SGYLYDFRVHQQERAGLEGKLHRAVLHRVATAGIAVQGEDLVAVDGDVVEPDVDGRRLRVAVDGDDDALIALDPREGHLLLLVIELTQRAASQRGNESAPLCEPLDVLEHFALNLRAAGLLKGVA